MLSISSPCESRASWPPSSYISCNFVAHFDFLLIWYSFAAYINFLFICCFSTNFEKLLFCQIYENTKPNYNEQQINNKWVANEQEVKVGHKISAIGTRAPKRPRYQRQNGVTGADDENPKSNKVRKTSMTKMIPSTSASNILDSPFARMSLQPSKVERPERQLASDTKNNGKSSGLFDKHNRSADRAMEIKSNKENKAKLERQKPLESETKSRTRRNLGKLFINM